MRAILVSACLLGVPCRYHGNAVRASAFVKKYLAEHPGVKLIPVCPEQLGGLPTPRPPVKTVRGRVHETCPEKENRCNVTGPDVTDAFIAGAEAALAIAKQHRCKVAILMKTSPSCSRTGITGKLLFENGIEVIGTF